MPLTVKWDGGVAVGDGETTIILDPQRNNQNYRNILITHSHSDHAKGFHFNACRRYSTSETLELANLYRRVDPTDWEPLFYRKKIRIGSLEVEAHNAGHILGSALFEIITSEGNLLYTGDLNTVDTLTMKAAEVVPCDILVIESTFGSPGFVFPSREGLSVDILNWTVKTMKEGKIPVLHSDSIGNSQELIYLFNQLTTIPVVTHPRVSMVNEVYRKHGFELSYIDAASEDAKELLTDHECVFIAPKRGRLPENLEFEYAYASGWAIYTSGGKKGFPLSDHADFPHLLDFVRKTHPRLVLTCFGGRNNEIFASYVERKLGIRARPLSTVSERVEGKTEAGGKLEACSREILRIIRIPGFNYRKKWVVKQARRKGFSIEEVEATLDILVKRGILRFLEHLEEYELR